MAEQSKAANSIVQTLIELLVGSNKKKFVSATVLLIIAFLLQVKGKKIDTEELLKLKP